MLILNEEDKLKIVETAAVNAKFRDKLIESPKDAAESLGITLEAADDEELRGLAKDLKRFGGNPALNPDDAKSWAIGICQIREL